MKLEAITPDDGSRGDDAGEFLGTDRFLIQRRLGVGAYGVVYEAWDREHDALIALKVLRLAEADALYRFKKGFRSLADLRHPNLMTFHELVEDRGRWFLTQELVDGVDFVSWLRRTPDALDYARVRDALAQLARGLEYLHQNGKLHRDVKPPNVLVTTLGRVVLLDFGLVAELGPRDRYESAVNPIAGTPAYMAPEQIEGEPASPASDWYSAGVMLYETLAGELPFTGSLLDMTERKRRGLTRPLAEVTPGVPPDLQAICEGLLIPDPARRTSGETVLRQLTAASALTSRPAVHTALPLPPRARLFVGRGVLLAALRQALEASRRAAVTVLLHGASGMGKTALAGCFLDALEGDADEILVLRGRCYRQEAVPYKAVDSLIDTLSRHLNTLPADACEELLPETTYELLRLFPVLGRVRAVAEAGTRSKPSSTLPQTRRQRAFAALRELFGRLARRSALVLFIDDLHWGDVDSAALLEAIIRPPDAPRLLFMGTYRSELAAASPFLDAWSRRRTSLAARGVDVREIELDALPPDEAEALAAALLGPGASAREIAATAREAGGHPFFLTELARFALDGTGADTSASGLRLADVVAARIARLPAPARRLLEVVAVAGQPLELEVSRQAAGLGPVLEDALVALRGSRLLRHRTVEHGEELETYHDRVRETVLDGMDESVLREHHQALALALESSGRAAPETLAMHFRMTEDRERASGYASAAAARAEKALAFERAARLYRMALELVSETSDERFALVVKLAAALANAGHGREAADTYLRAVRDAGYLDPLELQRNAAEKLLASGHIDRGLAVLSHVLRRVDMGLYERPWRARAALALLRLRLRLRGLGFRERPAAEIDSRLLRRIDICWSVEIGMCLVDGLHASVFHVRHLLLALRAGEIRRIARGLAMEVFFGALEGADVESTLARARDLARRSEGSYALGLTELAAGMLACSRGAWPKAESHLQAAAEDLQEAPGAAWELDTVEHFRVLGRLYRGRWRTLFAELPELLEQARARGDRYLEVHLALWLGTLRDLAADDPDAAAERAEQTIRRWSHRGFHYQHFGHLMAGAQTALYRGDGAAAWSWIEERWRGLARSRVQRLPMVYVQSHDLRARCALAAATRAPSVEIRQRRLTLAAADARRMIRVGTGWAQALGTMIEAGVAAVRGQDERAEERLRDAENRFAACDMSCHAAAARRRLGQQIGGDEGHAKVVAAGHRLAREGVRDPERIAAVLAPGFLR